MAAERRVVCVNREGFGGSGSKITEYGVLVDADHPVRGRGVTLRTGGPTPDQSARPLTAPPGEPDGLFKRELPDGSHPAEAGLRRDIRVAAAVWLLGKDAGEAGLRATGAGDPLIHARPAALHDRR
jgi:hypothetical protein